ncbi:expressed unknown protein [Seminavis robusta]|uniref:EGF-like domain-containing protein n=1 Tax=Seminavis robusta TaxID=568900 RepID=A0A9N8DNE1_9STRA|nr:expressed unknown protein [Seminavis robusta]|eukprot:Sro234_g094400.1 n/a (455) ;mRNA; f:29813-31287
MPKSIRRSKRGLGGSNASDARSTWRRVSLILLGLSLIAYRSTKNPFDSSWGTRLMSSTSLLLTDLIYEPSPPPQFSQANIARPICTEPTGGQCRVSNGPIPLSSLTNNGTNDYYTCDGRCSNHATCFFGTCMCHPGYEGPTCEDKMLIANPWYTADCPNLRDEVNTLNVNATNLGGVEFCHEGLAEHASLGTGLSYCAYLCYSNVAYGSAIVPHALWKKAQEAENNLWAKISRGNNDRYNDHFQGFAQYKCVPRDLGHVVEFGAGPWTQIRGLLSLRPDVKVKSYTVLEPGADFYIESVASCTYKTGKLSKHPDTSNFHDFPVFVKSSLGETAMTTNLQFDTVMVSNVIEHVQNAVDFLHGIHKSLKPGGLLIFHDRYYSYPEAADKVLGRNVFHPIRLTQRFFDLFLADFDIIFNNCEGEKTIHGWKRRNGGERGYYVVARKKVPATTGVAAN